MTTTDIPVKPGDVLDGKYRVEKVLGAGGMGVVVQARHIDLNTRFAIKFMLPEALKDEESVKRFQREARAAVQLKSEHTARVHDTGRLRDGAPYMVMEFLVGKDLGSVIEESGALPPHDAVEFILQACEAIAEAHALGIVHRDLKPRNLFLSKRVDGRPLVKVLDFGLAKHIDGTADHALTRTTAVMGSPQYMSPEQMRASRDVDGRTDIWSLGVCLYELLTGAVPFDAPTVPELCAMVLKDPARPPHDVNPQLPLALSVVIVRCLQKDPRERFANVADLAEALEQFASASSRGSASRVRHVLTTTSRNLQESGAPPPLRSEAYSVPERSGETRTAASFDPQQVPRGPSTKAYVLAVGGAVAASLLVVGIIVFALFFKPKATASHDLATKPPTDIASATPPPPPTDLALAPGGGSLPVAVDPPAPPPTTPPVTPPPTVPTIAKPVTAGRRPGGTRPPPPSPAATTHPPAPPPVATQQPTPPPAPAPKKDDPADKF